MSVEKKRRVGKGLATGFGLAFLGFIYLKGDEMDLIFTSRVFRGIITLVILVLVFDMWRREI